MPTINVIDKARPQLAALIRRIENPAPGLMIAGRAVRKLLIRHFQHKHKTEPNKLGGTRQNYWLGVADAVNLPKQTGAAQVTISISHPSIMQKIKGGVITAKRAKMLTIPVDARAYGRRASVLEQALGIKLFAVAKGGRGFLAGRVEKGKGSGLRIFYLLRKSVNQRPDPTALPPEEQMRDTATKYFGDWVLASQKKP